MRSALSLHSVERRPRRVGTRKDEGGKDLGKGQKDAVPLMVAVRLFRFALLFLLPLLLSGRFGAIPSLLRMMRNHFWMT
jgi:hypothetical protein